MFILWATIITVHRADAPPKRSFGIIIIKGRNRGAKTPPNLDPLRISKRYYNLVTHLSIILLFCARRAWNLRDFYYRSIFRHRQKELKIVVCVSDMVVLYAYYARVDTLNFASFHVSFFRANWDWNQGSDCDVYTYKKTWFTVVKSWFRFINFWRENSNYSFLYTTDFEKFGKFSILPKNKFLTTVFFLYWRYETPLRFQNQFSKDKNRKIERFDANWKFLSRWITTL